MKKKLQEVIMGAQSMVLATTGPHGINVVPVSVWQLIGNELFLYDFFMHKTKENVQTDEAVAVACWRDFVGVQLKGIATYETHGPAYEAAIIQMKERFPDRTLHGLIRVTLTEVYDVAPGANTENILG
ncbi:MAG: pyridoxamine 5'-phosphate oxidase family protein [Candidatus Kaiserbacteria bacterium]|nr:pyridoxamine 5'-phosphate oxidase family protein [Candidatus Kaiserbacteria bacterium]MCB9816395.1 pyridoxamine 5'-phosphate oxidase family protein [Candidatus Nomurabacteria bacterium]